MCAQENFFNLKIIYLDIVLKKHLNWNNFRIINMQLIMWQAAFKELRHRKKASTSAMKAVEATIVINELREVHSAVS